MVGEVNKVIFIYLLNQFCVSQSQIANSIFSPTSTNNIYRPIPATTIPFRRKSFTITTISISIHRSIRTSVRIISATFSLTNTPNLYLATFLRVETHWMFETSVKWSPVKKYIQNFRHERSFYDANSLLALVHRIFSFTSLNQQFFRVSLKRVGTYSWLVNRVWRDAFFPDSIEIVLDADVQRGFKRISYLRG